MYAPQSKTTLAPRVHKGLCYFIERLDTQQWYSAEFPSISCPLPHPPIDRWINDPLKALSFKTKKEARQYLKTWCLKTRIGGGGKIIMNNIDCIDFNHPDREARDYPLPLDITEHIID